MAKNKSPITHDRLLIGDETNNHTADHKTYERTLFQTQHLEELSKICGLPKYEDSLRSYGKETLIWTWIIFKPNIIIDPKFFKTKKMRDQIIKRNKKKEISYTDLLVLADKAEDLGLEAFRLLEVETVFDNIIRSKRKKKSKDAPISHKTRWKYWDKVDMGVKREPVCIAKPEEYYQVKKVVVWCPAE